MGNERYLTFYNGKKMPIIGYGTWRAPDAEIETALELALEAGYRHIDAAPVYLNEPVIGRVLKKWIDSGKVKREDLFITTKLAMTEMRPESVEAALDKSLTDLQLSYIDLYLIHTPFGLQSSGGDLLHEPNGDVVLDLTTDHVAIWKKLEEAVTAGKAKSIGLSNFNQRQIQRIIDNSTIKPACLQVELHMYFQQKELVEFCKANNIAVTAYSPLGSRGIKEFYKKIDSGNNREIPDLLEIPAVNEIANRLGKTPAQILLKWILERGIAAIPKSTNAGRLRQNLDLFDFELTADDMKTLNGLDEGIRILDFSFFKGIRKHPEFPF